MVRRAAERNSAVNALVRDFLTNLAAHDDRAKRARARLCHEGLSRDEALADTLDCYPEAGLDAIKAILDYRAAPQFQTQP